jgi:hypothetical protein
VSAGKLELCGDLFIYFILRHGARRLRPNKEKEGREQSKESKAKKNVDAPSQGVTRLNV